jgi:hypothetical protein
MSEFTNTREGRTGFRWQLLTTVSAIALFGFGAGAVLASDDDSDRPTFWIELGGQLSQLENGQEIFSPTFPNSPARPSIFLPSQPFEKPPLYSIDETGGLSFQPDGSEWVFSASIHYGRSDSEKNVHQQTAPGSAHNYWHGSGGKTFSYLVAPLAAKFADTDARASQSHAILDFQAGKDVGLGMFGNKDTTSVLSLGVRYAQFSSKSNIALKSHPDRQVHYKYFSYPSAGITHGKIVSGQPYHSNAANLTATRSFHGIGPSISWNASAPFVGNEKDGELTVNWGLNAALLFGRQRTKTHHQTTGRYAAGAKYDHGTRLTTYQGPATPDHIRSRTVIVPNVGGFAGLSLQIQNFKVSAGYRADLFFGAVDGGIDTRKTENVGFYGPFATVSVGIGG